MSAGTRIERNNLWVKIETSLSSMWQKRDDRTIQSSSSSCLLRFQVGVGGRRKCEASPYMFFFFWKNFPDDALSGTRREQIHRHSPSSQACQKRPSGTVRTVLESLTQLPQAHCAKTESNPRPDEKIIFPSVKKSSANGQLVAASTSLPSVWM